MWQVYTQPGDYAVVLTVTDDAGNKGTTTKTVTVGTGGTAASFSYLPTTPTEGHEVYFNGVGVDGPNGICLLLVELRRRCVRVPASRPSHKFNCPGSSSDKTFVVALTVKDTLGATATLAKEVKVTKCGT